MLQANSRRRHTTAVARVVGAAVLFSTGGAAIKTAALSGLQVASLRSGIAAAALLLLLRGRVRWSWRVCGVGAVYAATLVLFVSATKLTTAASAIFLQSAAPLHIAVLAPLVLGERVRGRDLVVLAAAATGLTLCFVGRPAASLMAPDPAMGNILGILCSLSWASTLLGLRWLENREPDSALSAVVVGNLLAFLAGVPVLWPLPGASGADWATLAYLGVVQIGCAYVLLTGAVRHLPALQVSLLLLLEPVLNPVWTWMVRGENPGAWTLAGGAVIVCGAAVQAVYDARASAAV
jgi:drug/metabolite transporter, DME family